MADNYKSVNKSLVLDNVTRQHKQNVRNREQKSTITHKTLNYIIKFVIKHNSNNSNTKHHNHMSQLFQFLRRIFRASHHFFT